MLVVPYGALGFVSFMVYRHLRVRAHIEQQLLDAIQNDRPDDPSPLSGDSSCSTTSPDATS